MRISCRLNSRPLRLSASAELVLALVFATLLSAVFHGDSVYAQQSCPCSIWSTSTTPGPMITEAAALELGVKFTSDAAGSITGLRFYKYAENTGTHVGNLWTSTGTLLATATFTNETASGWQQQNFPSPIAIAANTTYVASYHTNTGFYAANSPNLAVAVDNAPLHALASGSSGGNGVYAVSATSAFPTSTYNAANYWVDVVFTPGSDTTPPTVTSVTPTSGAAGVAVSTGLTATFSEALLPSTITTSTVLLKNPSNVTIAATVSYNPATLTATLTPSTALALSTTYTATVVGGASGVKDSAGNPLASNFSWSFTTAAAATCPCSIWGTSTTPGPMISEAAALELGVKFTSDAAGSITGLRFYKYAQNTGTHVGNLWSSSGSLLGTVTFANETASGWQQATFPSPVAITANTTYIASYHTNTGFYAANSPNLAVAVDNPPLHALSNAAPGGNGVYAVSATSVFPTSTYNAANYWVDVVFTSGADVTPPTVTGVTPANGATGVSLATNVTATFSEAMNASTITGSSVVLKDPSNATVAATVSYNAATLTATLTPTAALANSTTYTATITGGASGVKDSAGNALVSTYAWSFTTVADTTPPTVTGITPANGATGVSLATSVTATFSEAMTASTVTGATVVLKDPSNATVAATVSYNAATLIATLTPTAALANSTTYTGTITGGASGVKDSAGNALVGTYAWSFTTVADTTPPTVTGVTPANGAAGVSLATSVTATFSEAMTASTITGSTVVLKDPSNTTVAATVTYSAGSLTATLTPTAALAYSTTYTATITGGATGVKDSAGNPLASNYVWSFTTAADTTPPTVTVVAPASGATGISLATSVTATFSEAITASTVTGSTVVLKDESDATVTATVTYNAATLTATLTPTAALAYSTTYTATITGGASGVKDSAGNALANDYAWSFTTAADTSLPTVSSVTPSSGATGVAVTSAVTATFSEGMMASTITTSTFVLKNPSNVTVSATVAYDAATRTATLTSAAALAISTTYTATIVGGASGVQDAVGNALSGNHVWSFTTAATAPPTVTVATPTAGSTGVSTSTTVRATFSEAMTSSSITTSTFVLKDPTNTTVAATVTYSTFSQRATLTPSTALAYSTTYTATVVGGASGVKDSTGDPLTANYTWSFTTVADTTPPTVTSVTPSSGATGVAVTATVNATFSEALTASTVTTSTVVLKDPGNTTVAATVAYNAATRTATLTPAAALAYSTTYTATVVGGASGVKDAAGNALLTNYIWSFTTGADPTPPTVTGVTPSGGATGLAVTTAVTATFSKTMNASTMTTSTVLVKDPTNVTVAAIVSYNAATRTVTLTPTGSLANSTTYTATVVGGVSGVTDTAGNALVSNYTWSFTTMAETIPPTITGVAPAVGATGVASSATVSVTFSEAITASTISTSTIKLKDDSNALVTATVAYDAATFTATLTPSAALADSTTFTATVAGGASGVKDLAGNALVSDYSWSFTTIVDTSGPAITVKSPAPGATNVAINSPVTVTFNKAMTPGTVSAGITLRDASNALVAATVTYDASSKTATLTPTSWLAKGALHTVTVAGGSGGVKDSFGYGMSGNVSWSFTTQAAGCPCSIWTLSTPAGPMANDTARQTLGVKFRSDIAGFITGLRFYKHQPNTGTHVGTLWTSGGTQLGSVTFANETASGWQQAFFTTPIAITANTTYVASYHTDTGFYAATVSGLTNAVDNGPLHALASGASSGNGVYVTSSTNAFPTSSFNAANYWVDVVFTTSGSDATPPWVTGTSPTTNSMGISPSTAVTATFSESMDATSITTANVELRDSSNALVPAVVTYNASSWTATLTPIAALANGGTYTATVKTGARDVAGNGLPASVSWAFTTTPAVLSPAQGSGGPMLVVTSASNPFSQYYPEILRAEGLNAFEVRDLSTVTGTLLAGYDIVILGQQTLTATQAAMFTNWVQGGGNLVAFRPDPQLAALLGLSPQSSTLSNGYLAIDTTQAPGAGLVSATMQFHGTADLYIAAGARTVATLYSDSTHATAYPAVTLNSSGSGQAAAFSYDLAKSVIYTRQGNPAWAGTERDGLAPIRSDDLFFGAKVGDVQPDWIDFSKIQIPQADEQQRLLANLVLLMNAGKTPLPRFWYLPQGRKAVVVMTGDDHGFGSTVVASRFTSDLAQGPSTCQLANWDCIRATTYLFPNSPVTDAQAATWRAQGFEVALHTTMDQTWAGCGPDFTPATLAATYTTELSLFNSKFPSAGSPTTHRMHCIMWSDWSSQPTTELSNGIRLDTSYYYWPGTWVLDRPGLFTGSGLPMRYAASSGAPIDVYQAATQLTDESGQTYPTTINTLLDNAIGAPGYYGVITANVHTDSANSQPVSDAIVASAKARGVAVITADQMLTWLDTRNRSTFGAMAWSGNALTFNVLAGGAAPGLQAMIPTQAGSLHLTGVTLNAAPVTFTTQTIKGVAYAFVTVGAGQYVASYAP